MHKILEKFFSILKGFTLIILKKNSKALCFAKKQITLFLLK